jgi:hypothetical protein
MIAETFISSLLWIEGQKSTQQLKIPSLNNTVKFRQEVEFLSKEG